MQLCVFLNKREVLSRFFEKSNIFKYFSTCQTRSDDFWILNAMCMFIYLFVVYFSLTSTLHHDIFTYLDYIFSCYLHTVGFYPYLLSYIYIYIYNIYIYIYIYIWVWAETIIDDIISAIDDFFLLMGSKHCDINERSV